MGIIKVRVQIFVHGLLHNGKCVADENVFGVKRIFIFP